jgi:hypothetical protein
MLRSLWHQLRQTIRVKRSQCLIRFEIEKILYSRKETVKVRLKSGIIKGTGSRDGYFFCVCADGVHPSKDAEKNR